MKIILYLSLIFILAGCISAGVEHYGLVEIIKYPEGKEAKQKSEYAPIKTSSTQDVESDIGIIKVQYMHYTGYVKNQIREIALKKMYDICDKKYEILQEKKLSERTYQAYYNSNYVNGTGGASGSAVNVLLTGELIAFRCIE